MISLIPSNLLTFTPSHIELPFDSPWLVVKKTDPIARAIADRHYNRQHIGAVGFMPPGRTLVLLAKDHSAVWGTSYPYAEWVRHAWAGAWVNSLFRNEGEHLSSVLIEAAFVATCHTWAIPPLGMVTFVDPSQVRHKRDPGRCYLRAGFKRVGMTQGGLVALQRLT